MARPYMPEAIKRAAIVHNMERNEGKLICAETGMQISSIDVGTGKIAFDHSPALALRRRIPGINGEEPDDTDASSYEPHANDPRYLDVVLVEGHAYRTNKKRGLNRGDQTQIAHGRKVRSSMQKHRDAMAAKGSPELATALDKLLPPRPKIKWPKKKYNRKTKRFETALRNA